MCSQSWGRMWRTDGSLVPLGSWCGLPQGPQGWVECHCGHLQDPWWSTEEMDSPTGTQAALPLTCCLLRQGTLSPRLQLLKKEGGLEGWFPTALDHSWTMMLKTLYLEGMALLPFLVPSPPGWWTPEGWRGLPTLLPAFLFPTSHREGGFNPTWPTTSHSPSSPSTYSLPTLLSEEKGGRSE